MGRFYQTTDPKFTDYVFQPNLELKLLLAEQEVKNNFLKEKLLQEAPDININHLNFESENERVKEIQNYYRNGLDDIAKSIYENKNPTDITKDLISMKNLQKEMLEDISTGNWYHIEQRYKDYNNWLKNHEKTKETDPNLFNRLNNHWLSTLETEATENPDARFKGQQIVERPEIINSLREEFENVKANVATYKNGKYFIKDKEVTENEISEIALHNLLSRPNYQGYVNQMGNILGDSNYDQSFFELVNKKGETISYEDFNKLNSEAKKDYIKILNNKNPFYHDLSSVAKTYSFSEREIEEDKFDLQNDKFNKDRILANDRFKYDIALENEKQKNREKSIKLNYKNDYDLAVAKGDIENPNLDLQIIKKENFKIFEPKQLKENSEFMFDVLRRLGDKDPKNNPSEEEILKARKLEAIFRTAGEDNNIPVELGVSLANVNDKEWGWEFKKVSSPFDSPTGINNRFTLEKVATPERIAAEKFIAENKEKYENFNKNLLENLGYEISAVQVQKDGSKLSNNLLKEFDIAVSGPVTLLNSNYLPITSSLGNKPVVESIGVEGYGDDNIVLEVAKANGVKPSEIFEGGISRMEQDGQVFWKGTIKQEMLEKADPRYFKLNKTKIQDKSTGERKSNTILIKPDEFSTNASRILAESYSETPEIYEMIRSNGYHDINMYVETSKKLLDSNNNNGKSYQTALPNTNTLYSISKDDKGYYINIDGTRVTSSTRDTKILTETLYKISKGDINLNLKK